MNILLCSLGSHGDVNPYLALGRELLARGHGVTFATSSYYRELVEGCGLRFAPIRPDSPLSDRRAMARIMDARRGPEAVIREHLMPSLRHTYDDLSKPVARADVLVSHVLTYAVPVLAERFGKPWASTVLSPMVFFSAHDVPVLAPLPLLARLGPLGPGFNGWLIRQMKRVSRSWSRPVAELRRELGLPPGRDPLWEGQHSPRLVLAMFASRFGPPQPDWPPNVHVTQGGVGTTAQALRAGVPQLVIPFAHDQYDNASRVRRLGCGRVLRRGRLSFRTLANELRTLLANAQFGRTALEEGRLIRGEGGAAHAAEVLLRHFA